MDHARDELMSHIHRCGVLKASQEQQDQWLEDTMQFMSERFSDLEQAELDELRAIGRRFCQPVIPHGKGNTAISTAEPDSETDVEAEQQSEQDSEQGEMAGIV
ncbi:MAG: hypothetical protein WD766_05495 [Gemmatimonadota bacterium]